MEQYVIYPATLMQEECIREFQRSASERRRCRPRPLLLTRVPVPEVIEWTARFVDLAQPIVTATVLGAVNLIVNSHPLGGSVMTTSGEFKYFTTLLESDYIRTVQFY